MADDRHSPWYYKAESLKRQFQAANIPEYVLSGGYHNYTPDQVREIKARERKFQADRERLNHLTVMAGNLLRENPRIAKAAGVSDAALAEQYPAGTWRHAVSDIIGTTSDNDASDIEGAVTALAVLIGLETSISEPTTTSDLIRSFIKGLDGLRNYDASYPYSKRIEGGALVLSASEAMGFGEVNEAWHAGRKQIANDILALARKLAEVAKASGADPTPFSVLDLDSKSLIDYARDAAMKLPNAKVAVAPKTSHPTGPTPKRERALRQPKAHAIQAYRVWFATQRPQAEIATLLTESIGRPIKQNQVSRWIKQVARYVAAGNVLPDLPKPAPRRATAVDPSKIEMGMRGNKLTPRQRSRQSNED